MNTFFNIAWRNVWRNRRRSLLCISAIVFSIFITIFFKASDEGGNHALIRSGIQLMKGYIQIQGKGYNEDPTLNKSFTPTREILKTIEDSPVIKSYAFRLEVPVLVATETNSLGGLLLGIDPDKEKGITVWHEKPVKGNYLTPDDTKCCVIGEIMAQNLQVDVGGDIVLLGQSYDGSTGAGRFRVKGILKTGSDEMDGTIILLPLKESQDLFHADNLISYIVLSTGTPAGVEKAMKELSLKIPAHKFDVLSWRQLMPEMVKLLVLNDVFGYVFWGLLVLVVIFGVLSAIFTSVLERTREFGILLALGTTPQQIVLMVMIESFILNFIGLILGVILGTGVTSYFVAHPIPLMESTEALTASYGIENKIFFSLYPEKIAVFILVVLAFSLLLSWYPAWKASRLKPDRAIRNIQY